jgi:hypothetical protein
VSLYDLAHMHKNPLTSYQVHRYRNLGHDVASCYRTQLDSGNRVWSRSRLSARPQRVERIDESEGCKNHPAVLVVLPAEYVMRRYGDACYDREHWIASLQKVDGIWDVAYVHVQSKWSYCCCCCYYIDTVY